MLLEHQGIRPHVHESMYVAPTAVICGDVTIAENSRVFFGAVEVGDPAEILPPGDHKRIWAVQEPLDFPRTVFGLERAPAGETIMPEMTRRYARALGRHRDDLLVEEE